MAQFPQMIRSELEDSRKEVKGLNSKIGSYEVRMARQQEEMMRLKTKAVEADTALKV